MSSANSASTFFLCRYAWANSGIDIEELYNDNTIVFDPKKRVAGLRKDLRELCNQRDFIDKQIVNVRLALVSLSREINDQEERAQITRELAATRRKPGLTQRIAECLYEMPYADLSAAEVRKWLERVGVDLSDYSQPLATISITLSRMARGGRLKATRKGRSVRYRWAGD